MPITTVDKDVDALTLTVVGDFAVSRQRLWEAWADPRQLERFWGPPTWPATFTQHDMFPGGRSAYVMTGPDGSRSAGYWVFLDVTTANRSRCGTASRMTTALRTTTSRPASCISRSTTPTAARDSDA